MSRVENVRECIREMWFSKGHASLSVKQERRLLPSKSYLRSLRRADNAPIRQAKVEYFAQFENDSYLGEKMDRVVSAVHEIRSRQADDKSSLPGQLQYLWDNGVFVRGIDYQLVFDSKPSILKAAA